MYRPVSQHRLLRNNFRTYSRTSMPGVTTLSIKFTFFMLSVPPRLRSAFGDAVNISDTRFLQIMTSSVEINYDSINRILMESTHIDSTVLLVGST